MMTCFCFFVFCFVLFCFVVVVDVVVLLLLPEENERIKCNCVDFFVLHIFVSESRMILMMIFLVDVF